MHRVTSRERMCCISVGLQNPDFRLCVFCFMFTVSKGATDEGLGLHKLCVMYRFSCDEPFFEEIDKALFVRHAECLPALVRRVAFGVSQTSAYQIAPELDTWCRIVIIRFQESPMDRTERKTQILFPRTKFNNACRFGSDLFHARGHNEEKREWRYWLDKADSVKGLHRTCAETAQHVTGSVACLSPLTYFIPTRPMPSSPKSETVGRIAQRVGVKVAD